MEAAAVLAAGLQVSLLYWKLFGGTWKIRESVQDDFGPVGKPFANSIPR
jgi:hypothetical protein